MNAAFAYRNFEGEVRTMSVRDCPNVEKARVFLEWLLDTRVEAMTR